MTGLGAIKDATINMVGPGSTTRKHQLLVIQLCVTNTNLLSLLSYRSFYYSIFLVFYENLIKLW